MAGSKYKPGYYWRCIIDRNPDKDIVDPIILTAPPKANPGVLVAEGGNIL
jgi:hypothetical protein